MWIPFIIDACYEFPNAHPEVAVTLPANVVITNSDPQEPTVASAQQQPVYPYGVADPAVPAVPAVLAVAASAVVHAQPADMTARQAANQRALVAASSQPQQGRQHSITGAFAATAGSRLTVGQLRKEAAAIGVSAEIIDLARDSDNPLVRARACSDLAVSAGSWSELTCELICAS